MIRVTASKTALLQRCGWWARPGAHWDPVEPSEDGDRGRRGHAALAEYARGVDPVVEPDLVAAVEHGKRWIFERIVDGLHDGHDVEQAFGWDPVADEAVTYDGVADRAYPEDGLFHGTPDLVLWGDTYAIVPDWKFGAMVSDDGPQLRTLAMMVHRWARRRGHPLERVTVMALEVSDSGVKETHREELTPFELDAVAYDLAEDIERIPTAEPRPGPHCSDLSCPARLSCPVGQKALAEAVEVIPADALVRRPEWRITDPITTPEQATATKLALGMVKKWCEAKTEELKRLAPGFTWPDANGYTLREGECTRTGKDFDKAVALAVQLGATPEQIASLTYQYQSSTGLCVSGGPGNTKKPRQRKKQAT